MILFRAVGDTIPPPPSPAGILHINGYDWAVRVLHSSALIVVGVLYTVFLFLWQWLIRAPKWNFQVLSSMPLSLSTMLHTTVSIATGLACYCL